MVDDYIRIAVVTGVHGLNGRLKILVISDIRERFEKNNFVFIKFRNSFREFKIINFIEQKGKTGLLQLDCINDRDSALPYKGSDVCIKKSEAEKTRSALENDSYYYYDIIGCATYCRGQLFGTVTDIIEAGAGEILIITNDRGDKFMVPFVESMVDTREIRDKRLNINPVEGLFDI
jgi:16S rRNA processing protein RimM